MSPLARARYLACAFGIALFATACAAPPRGIAGDAGFVDAFFDAATLSYLMNDPNCAGLRFYNARRTASDTKGTVIAIAVRANGTEIFNGTTHKYRMYDRISGSTTSTGELTLADAKTRIGYVKAAGEKYYATNWTRSAITTYLTSAGCNGLRLRSKQADANWSMEMHPVKLASGAATVNPAPPGSLCTEPCPTYCGTLSSNYIHLP
jgi:hypothetical protein